MKILYFSWIRTKIGKDKEVVILPKNVKNGSDLVDFLKTKGPKHADALRTKRLLEWQLTLSILP